MCKTDGWRLQAAHILLVSCLGLSRRGDWSGRTTNRGLPGACRFDLVGPDSRLTKLGHLPYVRMALAWGFFALLLVAIFWLTHGGFEQVKNQFQLLLEWFK